jgi:hypothetical protein
MGMSDRGYKHRADAGSMKSSTVREAVSIEAVAPRVGSTVKHSPCTGDRPYRTSSPHGAVPD